MPLSNYLSDYVERTQLFLTSNVNPIKLTVTAIAASALTASAIFTVQETRRRSKAKAVKEEIKHTALHTNHLTEYGTVNVDHSQLLADGHAPQKSVNKKNFDESLIREQLARNIAFLGEEGVSKLRKSFVIVVGCGGVGSWAAVMLLRSGVEHIRIIDFDQVTLSSLNRHAVATQADVGIPKVTAMVNHLAEIAPYAVIEPRIELFSEETAADLLQGKPAFVIDAIDNIDTKISLINYCHKHQLQVISSMGAGAKADPSRIQIADISETFEDPLARAVRRRLKKDHNILDGVTVAYSSEKPHSVKLLPLDESAFQEGAGSVDELAALPDFRVRILPVLGTIPAMFGMAIATHVILKLSEWEGYRPLPVKGRDGVYDRLLRDFLGREARVFNNNSVPFKAREVGYIVDEMWRSRSVLSEQMDKLALARWDWSKPPSIFNVVCMTRTEAQTHEENVGKPLEDCYDKETIARINRTFAEERNLMRIYG